MRLPLTTIRPPGAVRTVRLPGLFAVLLLLFPLIGQAQAPKLDIAILPDVSASVHPHPSKQSRGTDKDEKTNLEVQGIITDLISGNAFDRSKSSWTVDTSETPDTTIRNLFDPYLGRSEGAATSTPLVTPGRFVLVMPIGKFITVQVEATARPRPVTEIGNVGTMIKNSYPKLTNSPDKSTCYWYAMALAAGAMQASSPDAYYLFVFSDEKDDPDYLPPALPDSYPPDYADYQKNYARRFPKDVMESIVTAHYKFKRADRRSAETVDNFSATLIARFYPPGVRPESKDPVRLSWYIVRKKGALQPAPDQTLEGTASLPQQRVEPPAFKPVIQLLGGLQPGQTKTFSYKYPVIAWQLPFGAANTRDADRFVVMRLDGEGDQKAPAHPIGHLTAESIPGTGDGEIDAARSRQPFDGAARAWLDLRSGKYSLQIRSVSDDGSPAYWSEVFKIEVQPRDNGWLLKLSAGLLALALTVFVWTWFKLRTSDSASAAR